MGTTPDFASLGEKTDDIDVRLSHKIMKLFSEGLYTSPNKAIEELVANSFDAGADTVHVLTDLGDSDSDSDSTIAVIDNGEGMDAEGLQRHWFVGRSNKRALVRPPRGRRQIGKFGIGKLATYVLANRLTHISKCGERYYSASMDYSAINSRTNGEIEAERPVTIPLLSLTSGQARQAVAAWSESAAFQGCKMPLFGSGSPPSWTVSIMSDLKPMVRDVRTGRLHWILRTALPLRPDFNVWLDGEKIRSSKADQEPLRKWVIGKDITDIFPDGPGPEKPARAGPGQSAEHGPGLHVDGLGRVAGYAEMYENPLVGKSNEWGRSNGFFVYVLGRLLNEDDGHFGIQPNELRHGTFSRFRAVVHIDGLDGVLRSSREAVGDGDVRNKAHDVLRSIFNTVRAAMDEYDRGRGADANLSRRVTAGPASLSRRPIATLARAVAEGKASSRHLSVPVDEPVDKREEILALLDEGVMDPEAFIVGRKMDSDGDPDDVIAKFDVKSRHLRLNARHPFVTVFDEAFTDKKHSLPLELLAMGDVISEARMYHDGLDPRKIDDVVLSRDALLRYLAYESGRQSPSSVAAALEEASSAQELEKCVCDAFLSLGFGVKKLGGRGEPDGVAEAGLSAGAGKVARRYAVSIEVKSKKSDRAVPAKDVDISAVARHCRDRKCDHAVVVGPAFQGSGDDGSALAESIRGVCGGDADGGVAPITITLIAARDLARLVRLRPVKQVGLGQIRSLLCDRVMPEESKEWVDAIGRKVISRPPYRQIVTAIAAHQEEFPRQPVTYSALHTRLAKMDPPIRYEESGEIADLCKAMDQMSEGAIWAHRDKVELDQSAENAIRAIENALREYEGDRQDSGGRVAGRP